MCRCGLKKNASNPAPAPAPRTVAKAFVAPSKNVAPAPAPVPAPVLPRLRPALAPVSSKITPPVLKTITPAPAPVIPATVPPVDATPYKIGARVYLDMWGRPLYSRGVATSASAPTPVASSTPSSNTKTQPLFSKQFYRSAQGQSFLGALDQFSKQVRSAKH